jgi:DNA-binding IclR family transcriptional regulator
MSEVDRASRTRCEEKSRECFERRICRARAERFLHGFRHVEARHPRGRHADRVGRRLLSGIGAGLRKYQSGGQPADHGRPARTGSGPHGDRNQEFVASIRVSGGTVTTLKASPTANPHGTDEAGSEVPKDRDVVTAVVRGLSILNAFSPRDVWLGNGEIAARTGLPKPTVSRLARTLSALGYLRHSPRRRQHRLHTSVLALGYSVLGNLDVRNVARPSMQALADSCNALVALGARERLNMIHLETCHSNSTMLTLRVDTGSRARIATTAFGRALLAALSEVEREAMFEEMDRHYGERWPKLRRAIDQAIRDVRSRGFCIVMGLWQPDINAVAVPLLCPDGSDPLSIGCAGSARYLPRRRLEVEIGPRLIELARRVTQQLSKHP